jgi:hypothetical protein
MKVRESGMPDESYWETLFDVALILDRFGIDFQLRNVVEFGCGAASVRLQECQIHQPPDRDLQPAGVWQGTRFRCTGRRLLLVRGDMSIRHRFEDSGWRPLTGPGSPLAGHELADSLTRGCSLGSKLGWRSIGALARSFRIPSSPTATSCMIMPVSSIG